MEVLLKSTIKKLGKRGDVVNVSAGYARNYLLPRGMAVEVSAADRARVDAELKRMAKEDAERRESLKSALDALGKASVTIEMQATEEGHLYGSVTEETVADALAGEGHEVPADMVGLEKHIKEVGVYDVPVALAEGAEATVKVWVVASGGPPPEGEGAAEGEPASETEAGGE
jgi:large subunit ribosomal protein L9